MRANNYDSALVVRNTNKIKLGWRYFHYTSNYRYSVFWILENTSILITENTLFLQLLNCGIFVPKTSIFSSHTKHGYFCTVIILSIS